MRIGLIVLFLLVWNTVLLSQEREILSTFLWLEGRRILLNEEWWNLLKKAKLEKERFQKEKREFVPAFSVYPLRKILSRLHLLQREKVAIQYLEMQTFWNYFYFLEDNWESFSLEERKKSLENLSLLFYLLTTP